MKTSGISDAAAGGGADVVMFMCPDAVKDWQARSYIGLCAVARPPCCGLISSAAKAAAEAFGLDKIHAQSSGAQVAPATAPIRDSAFLEWGGGALHKRGSCSY